MTKLKYHFIGIGGIGMSGLAKLLLGKGATVSGSDLAASYTTEALMAAGANVKIGHSERQLPPGATVVYTTGISEENPEFLSAKANGHTILHRSDLLANLTKDYETIAVAGMHGKTSTSALMASILKHAGLDPSFAIGGMVGDYGSNSHFGDGKHFVIEACESDGTLLKYHPSAAIITNIDREHMDYFGSESFLMQVFCEFINKVAAPEWLFWCGDDQRLLQLAPQGVSYGFGANCDLRISKFQQHGWFLTMDLQFNGQHYEGVSVALTGKHNALNSAATFGLALNMGIKEETIRQALKAFKGVNRRCEMKGEHKSITIIDDYAHHPVEIKTTLQGIRDSIGERRLIALYQPHRYSRVRDCLGSYFDVFDDADEVYLTDIYAASEAPIAGIDTAAVLKDISESNATPIYYLPKEGIETSLASILRPHDVLVTLGAGDVTKVGGNVLQELNNGVFSKFKVAVIFGGRSGEHDISLLSAKNIISGLSNELYDVEYYAIAKTGHWFTGEPAKDYLINGKLTHQLSGEAMPPELLQKLAQCNVIFPVLHGPYGEDGTIQGLCEMLGLPYVGCNWRAAAVCMDKAMTKSLMQAHYIPTLDFISFKNSDWRKRKDQLLAEIKRRFSLPLFVKPSHLGSTLGVSKVNSVDDLPGAIEFALSLDSDIIVEPGVTAREIEFAVLGNDDPEVFNPGEILTNGKVYDYEGKYGSKDPIGVLPSTDLPASIISIGKELAEGAYRIVGASGMARIDFFLDGQGRWWLNEINPIPGFTQNSLYPLVCNANGLNKTKLMDRLIILALEKSRSNKVKR